ncbi:MAG: hypothetical protein ABW000_04975 [Actinoplanes sp.]
MTLTMRTRTAVAAAGLAGLLTLSACGGAPQAAPAAAAVDVADEAQALTAVGFTAEVTPAPSASAATEKAGKQRLPGLRKHLRKNTLHGEIAVQGKDAVRTIVVQRGTVTAVDAAGVTVKSTDGFTQTWTFGDKLKVVQAKKAVEVSAVKTGAEVGVAGAKDGDKSVARLIAIA